MRHSIYHVQREAESKDMEKYDEIFGDTIILEGDQYLNPEKYNDGKWRNCSGSIDCRVSDYSYRGFRFRRLKKKK